jgi:hypothetical protein
MRVLEFNQSKLLHIWFPKVSGSSSSMRSRNNRAWDREWSLILLELSIVDNATLNTQTLTVV